MLDDLEREILKESVATQRAYPCPRCKKMMESIEEADAHVDRCEGNGLPDEGEIPVLGEDE